MLACRSASDENSEAFRPVVPPSIVTAGYAVSWAYLIGDGRWDQQIKADDKLDMRAIKRNTSEVKVRIHSVHWTNSQTTHQWVYS